MSGLNNGSNNKGSFSNNQMATIVLVGSLGLFVAGAVGLNRDKVWATFGKGKNSHSEMKQKLFVKGQEIITAFNNGRRILYTGENGLKSYNNARGTIISQDGLNIIFETNGNKEKVEITSLIIR